MLDIEIIPLIPEDWQRYRQIRLEALQSEPRAFSTTHATASEKPPEYWQGRLVEAARAEKSWLLFAQAGSQLIGLVGAFISEEGSSAEIISFYVSPAWRGQGVGKALMETILQALRQNPALHTATLAVNARQEAAVSLYLQLGFRVTGQEEAALGDGNFYPEYHMERALRRAE